MTVINQPSTAARLLFDILCEHAEEGHVDFGKTVALAAERQQRGYLDHEKIAQLVDAAWVTPADDGGWILHPDLC